MQQDVAVPFMLILCLEEDTLFMIFEEDTSAATALAADMTRILRRPVQQVDTICRQ